MIISGSGSKYYDNLQNKTLEKVQSVANDVYLKSNNIKTGIENYNQVVALIIRWYQEFRCTELLNN